jgi:hypothetical protein
MNALRVGLVIVALVGALAAGLYFWRQSHPPLLPPPPQAGAPSTAPPAAKGPRFGIAVPPEAAQKPLPRLSESDPTILEALAALFEPQAVATFFIPESLVRHIVATIDNLPRETFAARLNPVRPAGGLMRTTGKDASLAIAPENAARYAPFLRLVQGVDPGKLVAQYVRLYPLFQQAYVDLGYPDGYFNDRLIEVIDHLLATPEVQGPIRLTVPHVLPEFADPALESRSAGQKVLIRMGSDNAATIKAKLAAVRRELVAVSKADVAR